MLSNGREVHRFGKEATKLLIPKHSFQLLCRDIFVAFRADSKVTTGAIEALQTAAESHLVGLFQDANMCAIHARRETLMKKDMHLAKKIRKDRGFVYDGDSSIQKDLSTDDGTYNRSDGVPSGW